MTTSQFWLLFFIYVDVVFMYNKTTIREISVWDKNCLIMTIQI